MCSAVVKRQYVVNGSARKSRLLLYFFLGIVLLAGSGCQSTAPVVKIGLVAPFEGRHRDVGYDALYSARLAVREINKAGGINGTRVALVALDDGGNPEFAAATARSLVIDPGVVAVVGHWLPETTAVAQTIYEQNGLVFLAGGFDPFTAVDPSQLAGEFVTAYANVTPFEEMPGPYAGPAYDAFQQLFEIFALAQEEKGEIDRDSVREALSGLQ
jgi:ABC-type branched-subunit amino acid transport system substrate-binding protein